MTCVMSLFTPSRSLSQSEFVALIAILMAMVGMSVDSMLPAMGIIATELGAAEPNDRQLILSTLFGGLTLGLWFYGPS